MQEKRQEVANQIGVEEAERQQLQQDLTILTKRLAQVDASLQRKVRITLPSYKSCNKSEAGAGEISRSSYGCPSSQRTAAQEVYIFRIGMNGQVSAPTKQVILSQTAVRMEYDKVIRETEGAYEQILQSSQTLLSILKKECSNIDRKQQQVALVA